MAFEGWFTLFTIAVLVYTLRPRRRRHISHSALVSRVSARALPVPYRRRQPVTLQAFGLLLGRTIGAWWTTIWDFLVAIRHGIEAKSLKGEWQSPPIEELNALFAMSSNPVDFPSLPTESTKITLRTENQNQEPSAQNQEPAAEPSYKIKLSRVQALAQLLSSGVTPEQFIQIQDGDRISIRDALLCGNKAGIIATAMGGARSARLAEIKAAAYEEGETTTEELV